MKKVFILLVIVLYSSSIFSQENNKPVYIITGKIVDQATKQPLEYATVIFKSIDTDKIKFGAVTNARGYFSIEVVEGSYNTSVEYVSYLSRKLNISNVTKSLHIGTIGLIVDVKGLNEVEIVGEKRIVDIKPNKIVYNVEKDISAESSTITDIIENIPSVSASSEGDFTILGQAATVMINGKTSMLSKKELLSSISAASIERVEVITNPGASFKASYQKIINIILKKGKEIGLNGSVTTTGGYKDYYGGLLALNQKSEKVNFYSFASYSKKNSYTEASSKYEYLNNGIITSHLNEESLFKSNVSNFTANVGFDFYLSKKATVTTSLNYSKLHNEPKNTTETKLFDSSLTSTLDNLRKYNGDFNNDLIELSADYTQQFSKEGHQIEAHLVFTKDKETFENNIINTNSSFTNENFTTKRDLENIDVNFKYTYPINENSNFYTGYSGEYGSMPLTYSTNENDIEISDAIHGAFVEYEYQWDKFYLGLGLRAEFADLNIDYLNTNSELNKEFDELFPTVSMDYSFTPTKNLSLTYDRNAMRPGYDQLQIFEEKYSETASYKGNEDIDPIFVDNLTLAYTYYGSKIIIVPSLFYNIYNDYFQLVTYNSGEIIGGINKTFTTWGNVGDVHYYGTNVDFLYNPNSTLSFSGNATIYNFEQKGSFEIVNEVNETIVQDYTDESINGSFSLLAQLKLPKLFNFQTKLTHKLESLGPVSRLSPNTFINASFGKDIFDKKGSLSLSVDDVFLSRKTDRDRFYPEYNSNTIIKNKYRRILLSFTYKFNGGKKNKEIDFDKKDIKPNF